MLTYDLTVADKPLYQYLYECIKKDIVSGKLKTNEKMPSKRTLAENLGVSNITIENAYEQLIGEGYMYTVPKKGYYISDISGLRVVSTPVKKKLNIDKKRNTKEYVFDFSSNRTESDDFPFSVWARLMREIISVREKDLMTVSPCEGVESLRAAIADHLSSFRNMHVDPDQIIVGAGTEYLYSLLIKLLGADKIYSLENPGYKKQRYVYESSGVDCRYIELDESGINIDKLKKSSAQIAHISPNHHFPTGITMPISRRYELLAWANEEEGRYIIEDDYDSEFRLNGKPIPTLQSIDANEKVIYMNTFSKSLTSTIRISYMVLPEHLANLFFEKLSFNANTVSTFEQYTLAEFISKGYFEKHINRMRLRYGRKRTKILEIIRKVFNENECRIIENGSGLHFVLEFNTKMPDKKVQEMLLKKKIKIGTISECYKDENVKDMHQFILNYSSLNIDGLENALLEIKKILKKK